ncbi:MAG: cation:proton antiporter [Thaumarchaeota archaeon]|nr:cation:proton antiporter [Nitrososphaerota archaeon]
MVSSEAVLSGILTVSILIFFAKILAGLFSRFRIPAVLGELSAGMILGPSALGAYLVFSGHSLIEISDFVLFFAEVGAILILFSAGLEMTFAEFRAAGFNSFIIGTLGVVLPFFSGFYLTLHVGYPFTSALIVAATLTATSIAITLKVLEELKKTGEMEAKVMINSAVVDDVLGLAVLAVVVSVIGVGRAPTVLEVASKLTTILLLWLTLLVVVVLTVPRLLKLLPKWRVEGTDEAAATVICFGSASIAALLGLSPIVGAYAAGMGLAGSQALKTVREYIEKINLVFAPVFFAVIGASLNFGSFSPPAVTLLLLLVAAAVLSKIVGCGVPAMVLLKNRTLGWRIGAGMVSRGEVGLVIAGIGLTSGVIEEAVYAALIGVVILTTILSPILLKFAYRAPRREKSKS